MNTGTQLLRAAVLGAAIALVLLPRQVLAQHAGPANHGLQEEVPPQDSHTGHAPEAEQPKSPPEHDHAATDSADTHDQTSVDHSGMDHGSMDHGSRAREGTGQTDHASMDHAAMGHGEHVQDRPGPVDHSKMDHAAKKHETRAPTEPRTPIPVLNDADRAAAAPPPDGHAMHDNAIHSFVLVDRLEILDADEGHGLEWEAQAWIGNDSSKLWLRTEGERISGDTEDADLEVLYGRSIARWWDVVAGVRHHFEPGGSQDLAVLGVMGVAPYKFEVEASVYVGDSGYSGARLEIEYETLLTNRLILQPALEVNVHGRDDESHGNGAGLGTVEAGLRLRYEISRRFAPYIGLVHERAFGRTAELRRDEAQDVNDTHVVVGLRIWF